jgi:MFS transporter, FHS family, glucose/mannose:H+ symporter
MASVSSSPVTFPVTTRGTVLIHVDFLLTGIVMTFLGPMLPHLSARWTLSDAKSGSLIFAEFFSSMFGMLLSGVLVQRLGYRLTLIIGLVLMPSGMVLLAFGPWVVGILSICLMGVGYGITTPAGNLRTAEVNPGRSASALNWINAVWGIGAMSSPFLVSIALGARKPWLFLFSTALALLILLLALAFSRFVPDHRELVSDSGESPRSLWTLRLLPLICVLFFIYVGTETSFGNWVAMYARRISPGQYSLATMTPSFFWGALLAGRALAPFALRFSRETSVARAGLLVALLGGVALALARGMGLIVAGAILAGLGLASIFPISVSLLPGWFGPAARRASGAVFGSGNMGGAVLPWVVGAVSSHFDSLRVGFFVPLLGVVAMLAFYIAGENLRPVSQKDRMLQPR